MIHYIEKIYKKDYEHNIKIISEIDNRKNNDNENDIRMDGFRYFDSNEEITGESLNQEGKIFNITKWIHNGKRYSMKDAKNKFANRIEELYALEDLFGCDSICLNDNGKIIPMNDGDITYSEYIKEFNKLNSKINKAKKDTNDLNAKETLIVFANILSRISEKDIEIKDKYALLLYDIVSDNNKLEIIKEIIFLLNLSEKNIPLDFILKEIDNLEYNKKDTEFIIDSLSDLSSKNMKVLNYYYKNNKNDKIKIKKREE